MVSSVLLALGAAASWAAYTYVSGLRSNILKARRTNIPYIVVPVHPFNRLWQLTFWIWIPLIKMLPKFVWEDWMFIMQGDWAYKSLQDAFDKRGRQSFIVASPRAVTLFTNDPEAIHQITQRREAFPKDTTNYTILSMFGENVLTTEGAVWRMHRKVTSASFNEKNAAHTFAEAINQTQGMMDTYFHKEGADLTSTPTIKTLEHDTMTLALNIIGYVGFGLRLLWPGQELPEDTDPKLVKYGALEPPPGYTMSFADALATTLEKIIVLLIFPWALLKRLPFEFAKVAWEGKVNYLKYMDDFLKDKMADVRAGNREREGMDIMGQLVRSKYGKGGSKDGAELSDAEIVGNAFIMTVAGHETTANTLHFTLLELANNASVQRQLQKDIDTEFGDSDPATWNYEQNVNTMLASYIGACMNETLRLMPPVVEVPKVVSYNSDQAITIEGEKRVLPAGMGISLVAVSVHRNPRCWPTRPSKLTGAPTDLDDYLPERWYRTSESTSASKEAEDDSADTEDYGGFKGSDTSASMYRPVRGSFIPFSDGARSCLGRRIAQVEMIAMLAVIFQKHSIELAVDEWASDEEVDKMSAEERRKVYAKAQEKSRKTIKEATSILTLKLNGGKHVPVRFVKRGHERFVTDPEL